MLPIFLFTPLAQLCLANPLGFHEVLGKYFIFPICQAPSSISLLSMDVSIIEFTPLDYHDFTCLVLQGGELCIILFKVFSSSTLLDEKVKAWWVCSVWMDTWMKIGGAEDHNLILWIIRDVFVSTFILYVSDRQQCSREARHFKVLTNVHRWAPRAIGKCHSEFIRLLNGLGSALIF